jgi:hypothetical protein
VKRENSGRLDTTIVWVPVLDSDTRSAAVMQADLLQTQDVVHEWDGNREASRLFATSLGLTGPGWDMYLVYGPGMQWNGTLPPSPSFWMHQLSPNVGVDPALYLRNNPNMLRHAVHDLLTS